MRGDRRCRIQLVAPVAALALSACATAPVMHSEAELNDVTRLCGLALGELIQDESQKKLLLVVRNEPTIGQRLCVAKWARQNHLKAVFVHMNFPEG